MTNMARNNLEAETGFYRLHHSAAHFELTWDQRQESLTFQYPSRYDQFITLKTVKEKTQNDSGRERNLDRMTLRLAVFTHFEHDLRVLSTDDRLKLRERLERLIKSRDGPPNHIWNKAIGRFAFFLIRFSLKHHDNDFLKTAEELLRWVGPECEETAWRIRYDENLRYNQRYDLIKGAKYSLVEQYSQQTADRSSPPDLPDREIREAYWWINRCQYEVAFEWYSSEVYQEPNTRHALREASMAYLNHLKDELRRQDLERFLSECGSSIEKEVKKVFFPQSFLRALVALFRRFLKILSISPKTINREQHQIINKDDVNLLTDETIRRIYFAWFLRRYNLVGAVRTIYSTSATREWRFFIASVIHEYRLIIN